MEISSSSAPSEGNSDSQNADLDGLIDYISKFVERSEKRNSVRTTLMDTILKRILEAGFDNERKALRLLEDIVFTTESIKKCQDESQSKEIMWDDLKISSKLVIECTKTCCAQIKSSPFQRFFMAACNHNKLRDVREKLDEAISRCQAISWSLTYDAFTTQPGLPGNRNIPMHAVGLKESVKEVIDALELESENRALAVVLHGVRGMGKTTLAEAVFSDASLQGFKHSRIKLFDNRESIPNITDLQRLILKDLKESRKIAEIRKPEEGQRELADILREVPAFIYIDNVVREDELRQLLPEDLNTAMKVRLLITARNDSVGRACPLKTRPIMYRLKGMSRDWAEVLFKRKLFDDMKGKLNPEQLDHILDICDGNPLMLIKVAKALCFDEDKRSIFVLQSKNSRLVVEGGKNKEKIEGS